MATRLDTNDPGFEAAFQALLETKRETGAGVDDPVRRILEDVRLKGDEAVIAYTKEFDGFELTAETMAVTADEIKAAKAASDNDVIGALVLAAGRIADFHKRQIPDDLDYTPIAILEIAHLLFVQRQYDAVIRYLNQAMPLYPNDPKFEPRALIRIGNCQDQLQRYLAAKETYKKCIDKYQTSDSKQIQKIVSRCQQYYDRAYIEGVKEPQARFGALQ